MRSLTKNNQNREGICEIVLFFRLINQSGGWVQTWQGISLRTSRGLFAVFSTVGIVHWFLKGEYSILSHSLCSGVKSGPVFPFTGAKLVKVRRADVV